MKNKTIKQFFTILMSFALVFSMFPATAFAWEEDDTCEFCGREIHDDWICEHGGHCSSETDDSCYEEHHCEFCGEATDEKCSECGRCADCEEEVFCPECNECTGEELCPLCGLCESCMEFYSCQECGNCNPDEFCDGCGFCEDCAFHCIECGACNGGEICEFCFACEDCALHCKECGQCEYETDICSEECGLCYDCGGTCSEGQEHACLECHDGASACDECGKCFGSDEHIDGVKRCMECGTCEDCMDSVGQCLLCGLCGNCRELCERCGGDSCVVCHEEEGIDEMAPCPDCGYCKTGMDYCTVCGICEECGDVCPDCDACFSCGDGYHCPDCDTCFEVARRCDQDGDHCVICCEENGWLCSECGECIEPKGDIGICRDCGACSDCNDFCDVCGDNDLCVDCCVEEEYLHCPECRGCYEDNGTAPCADCDICSDCADRCENCERCIDCTIADGSHCEDCEKCLIDDYLECELCGELICSDCVGYCEECQACLTCCYEKDYHCVECEECCNFYMTDPRWVGLCNECGRCQNCLGNENWCANCGGCNECMTKDPWNAIYYWHCTGCYICGSEVEEPFCETCHQCENCCICNASFTVTVNYESGGAASADATTVKYKNNVVLSATPDPGYQFKCWEVVEGGPIDIVENTFTMPGNNVTVKAVFVPLVAVHPEDVTVEEGQKAVFKASCESVFVDYYWEYSLPSVEAWSYANFAEGFMTDTMTVDATIALNGYKFRCVLLDGQGDRTYSDVAVLTVTEKPSTDIADVEITLDKNTFAYTGSAQGPTITVKDGGKTLVKDMDYTISGNTTGTAAGTYTFTITGKGNYGGTVEKTFTINPCTHKWDSGKVTTDPTCKDEGVKIFTCQLNKAHTRTEKIAKLTTHTYGSDHICDVCGDTNGPKQPDPGTPGTGGSSGSETTPDPGTTPGTGDNTGGTTPGTTPGSGTTPDTDGGSGSEDVVTPTPDAHQHSYVKTITKATAKKDGSIVEKCACGDVKSSVVIKKASKIKLSKSSYVYTGKVIKAKNLPKVIVKDSAGKTIAKSNYTIVKPKNVKKMKALGKYAYTIKFKGSKYKGSVKVYLELTPAKVTAKAPKAAKRAVTVIWKKGKKAQVTGYQVTVATDKKFTKNVKTKKIKGYSKTSYKMTKLKAKTKYYVKVRAYKVTKTGTVYGPWSVVKKAKTK